MIKTRIQDLSTLEELRIRNARSLRLCFSKQSFEANSDKIIALLNKYRRDRYEIAKLKRNADDPSKIPNGCSLHLAIDGKEADLNGRYVFMPADELIDGIRELADSDGVQVGYAS